MYTRFIATLSAPLAKCYELSLFEVKQVLINSQYGLANEPPNEIVNK